MKRWLILVALFLLYGEAWSQVVSITTQEFPPPGTITKDTVYYSSERKLQWDDFTGKVRGGSPSAALSFTGFSYDAFTKTESDTIQVKIYLRTYFVRDGSWVRPGEKNTYALSHEQLHFDIAKLAEEQFKDSLHLKTFDPQYYPIDIHFLYWDFWRKMNDMQEKFDDETNNGTNHSMEARWENKIRNALKVKEL